MNWKIKMMGTLLFTGVSALYAEDTLSLQKLVEQTLKANYDIQIAQLQVQQTENLATRGQAGFFPSISLGGNGSYSSNNTNLEFAGGLPPVERNGAINTAIGGNLGLNYTLFNGFGRVFNYRRLQQQFNLSTVQAKLLSENTVFEAINRYINAHQARGNALLAKENYLVSGKRLLYAQRAYSNGSISKLELLSAEIDAVTDSLSWIQNKSSFLKELFALNVSMGKSPEEILISMEIPVPVLDERESLLKKAVENNSSVLFAYVSKNLSQTQLKVNQSQRLPNLSLSASYGYQSSQNGAGIILSQSTLGVNSGINLSIPVFNGKQLTQAIKNAEIDVQKSQFEWDKAKLTAEQLMMEALQDQEVLQLQIKSLSKSIELAEQALQRAQSLYENGQLRFVELRAAQVAKLQAETNLMNARMNLIRVRYSIKWLIGELI